MQQERVSTLGPCLQTCTRYGNLFGATKEILGLVSGNAHNVLTGVHSLRLSRDESTQPYSDIDNSYSLVFKGKAIRLNNREMGHCRLDTVGRVLSSVSSSADRHQGRQQ